MDFEKKAKIYAVCCDILKKEIENLTKEMYNKDCGLVEVCPTLDFMLDSYGGELLHLFESE